MHLLQNWNYDDGTAKATKSINIYSASGESKTETTTAKGEISLDCENCFSILTADLVFSYSIDYGVRWKCVGLGWFCVPVPLPYLSVSFMAELNVQYKANLDFVFTASAEFKYSPKPISLAKLRPLVNEALSSLSIIGIGLPLKATFGMDIRYVSRLTSCYTSFFFTPFHQHGR
jgi:hypothetical protein